MIYLFIVIQCILFFFMALHDWIDVPPFTNPAALKKAHSLECGYLAQGNKAGFEEYQGTHSFLPPRGDNVVPNTLHVILHIQVWICFILSLYWLWIGGWKL